MADYKKMYYRLFNAQTQIMKIIEEAHVQTEEIFLDTDTEPLEEEAVAGLGDEGSGGMEQMKG